MYFFKKILYFNYNEILRFIFSRIEDTDIEFIIAVVIPLSKVCAKLVLSKAMYRMVGTENQKANVYLGITINVVYGLFVATRIVGARSSTVFCIVVMDFMIQSLISYRIVRLQAKVDIRSFVVLQKEKKKQILKLVLAELCEGLVPIVYSLFFAMSYY